jgi:hypothetical protein
MSWHPKDVGKDKPIKEGECLVAEGRIYLL